MSGEANEEEILTGVRCPADLFERLRALIRIREQGKSHGAMTIAVDGQRYIEREPHHACNRLALATGLPALPDNYGYGITQLGEFTANAAAWQKWNEQQEQNESQEVA